VHLLEIQMPQNWNETSRADVKAMPLTISDERVAQFFGLSIADVRAIRNERHIPAPRAARYSNDDDLIGASANTAWNRMMTNGSHMMAAKLRAAGF
jgi:hypothetical protein